MKTVGFYLSVKDHVTRDVATNIMKLYFTSGGPKLATNLHNQLVRNIKYNIDKTRVESMVTW